MDRHQVQQLKHQAFFNPALQIRPDSNTVDQGGNLISKNEYIQKGIARDSSKFREMTDLKAKGII